MKLPPEITEEKLEKLIEDVKEIREFFNAAEILRREIKPFGTSGGHISGAHISAIPVEHIGKIVRVVIPNAKKKEEK